MYHQFNINKFYILLTQYTCVLCVDLRKKRQLLPLTTLTSPSKQMLGYYFELYISIPHPLSISVAVLPFSVLCTLNWERCYQ